MKEAEVSSIGSEDESNDDDSEQVAKKMMTLQALRNTKKSF
jgi:hypothetical protein